MIVGFSDLRNPRLSAAKFLTGFGTLPTGRVSALSLSLLDAAKRKDFLPRIYADDADDADKIRIKIIGFF